MMLRFQPAGSASNFALMTSPSPLTGEGEQSPFPLAGEGRGGGSISSAFDALDSHAIRYAFRKGSELIDPYAQGSEIDILIDRLDLPAAETVLAHHGFRRLRAPGHQGHRFYLAFERGSWLKIDAKIARGTRPLPLHGRRWRAARHLLTALAQRRPLSLRRAGPVVALLGPDGAGKGTVIDGLKARVPVGLSVIYLGERRRARSQLNDSLPLVGSGREKPDSLPLAGRLREGVRVSALRECAFVIYRFFRFWRILLRGYLAAWSGHIVLCDRHPIEALAIRPRTTRAAAWLEQFLFGRLMPWPDAVAVLDAPGKLLYLRKHENSPEILEQQRQRYRETFAPRGARLISSTCNADTTIAAASEMLWAALKERRRW